MSKSIAIIEGGPEGSTLASFLAKKRHKVTKKYSMGLFLFMSGPLQDLMKKFGMHKYHKIDFAM